MRTLEILSPVRAPSLLASKVVTSEGKLDSRALPVPEVHRAELVAEMLERRLLPLRAARRGALLVRGQALQRTGVIDMRHPTTDDLEWTARLLRAELGVLVPTSVAIRGADEEHKPPSRTAQIASGIRLIRQVDRENRLWFAKYVANRGVASLRRPTRD